MAGDGANEVYSLEMVVGALWLGTGKPRDVVRAGAQGRREASPGRPRSLVTQAGKQLRACTCARGGVCSCGRWQGRS